MPNTSGDEWLHKLVKCKLASEDTSLNVKQRHMEVCSNKTGGLNVFESHLVTEPIKLVLVQMRV